MIEGLNVTSSSEEVNEKTRLRSIILNENI